MELEKNSEAEWKNKYGELLGEAESLGKERELTEKLLCRTIIRLTLAVNGLDQTLDPHLKKLRLLLKAGVKNDSLRKQVDEVSEVLLHADEEEKVSEGNFDATILFAFLRQCALSEAEKETIQKLEADHLSGKFSDVNSLLLETSHFLSEEGKNGSRPGFLSRLFGRLKKEEVADVSQKHELLKRLIEGLDAPVQLGNQLDNLKAQASKEGNGSPPFFDVLEDFISVLNLIKSKRQKEQEEFDDFLLKVTTQVERLEGGAEEIALFVQESSSATLQLNKNVSTKVNEIKQVSDGATTLGELKTVITTKLDMVAQHLEEHLINSEARTQKAEKENSEMVLTIKALEAESVSLKASIKLNRDIALSDSLTGVPNRQAYNERIEADFLRWKRFKVPLMIMVWDIDHFKDVNDRFGHQAGDLVLKEVAKILASNLRETDFVARYGGEEFVMLMLGISKEEALQKANSIREKIKSRGFNSNGKPLKVTASCGITQFGEADKSHEVAFERADKAMYEAKNSGRDRCLLG